MDIKNLIGHRGVAGLRPENSLSGFSFAAKLGLPMVEFDTHITQDNEWVVIHDDTTDRTTNSTGKVCDLSLQELMSLDCGLWYEPPYSEQKIPSLLEVLQLNYSLGLISNIEMKASSGDPEGEAALMDIFLKQNLDTSQALPIVSSFNFSCLSALRTMFPTLPIGYLIDEFGPFTIEQTLSKGFNRIHCNVNGITDEDLLDAKANNIPVYLFTVDSKSVADEWLEKGVAGIFSNRPDLLLEN